MQLTLNFSDALFYLKQGYYIRRAIWRKDRQCKIHDGHIHDCLGKSMIGFAINLTSEDLLANDWMIDETSEV